MKLCLKTLIAIIFAFSTGFYLNQKALAADFDAVYNVVYDVSENGVTSVNQEITLTNQAKNKYATKYNLSVGSPKLENIKAKDGGGEIKPEILVKEEITEIALNFNEKVIGLGKSLMFNISYSSKEIATKNGWLWEINIPKLSAEENITNYLLELRVPKSFGPLHYLSPKYKDFKETNKRLFFFEKETLLKSGLVAAFGKEQVFNLTLKYHLFNPNVFAAYTEIALPPDTSYQQVTYSSIEPRPQDIYSDKDGNYLAKYYLEGNEKIDVAATLQIKTRAGDKRFASRVWSNTELEEYLGPNKYWETNYPAILEKARELKSAEKIFEFVSTNLKYGYDRLKEPEIERFGAVSALTHPEQAICMEFTDLTIALLRAAGIPARELNGFAYTENKKLRPVSIGGEERSDVLHAWPEYYDYSTGSWIQVDPTWTSTTGGIDYFNKLDNNHLVFVIKGVSSERPHPAGSYKYAPDQQKDVEVSFAQELKETKPEIKLVLNNKDIISGFPVNSKITLKNNSPRGVFNLAIKIQAPQTEILPDNVLKIPILPPWSEIPLDVKFREKNLFETRDEQIKFLVSGLSGLDKLDFEETQVIKVKPFYVFAYLPILLIVIPLLLLIFIFYFIKTQVSKIKLPRHAPPTS